MPFSSKYKCLFIHVPKVAGSSIVSLDWWNHWEGHLPMRAYRGRRDWKGWFRFAFVRNPWDRFISAYEYLRGMTPDHRWYGGNRRLAAAARTMSIDEFLFAFESLNLAADNHFKTQSYWLTVDGRQDLSFVGRYEDLDRDFDQVCDRVGAARVRLPWHNRSPNRRREWRSYFSPEARRHLAEIYQEDIERFGYSFEASQPDSIGTT